MYLDFDTGNPKALTRKTTFLLGENGTGKTAFLQAVALVTGGIEALEYMAGSADDFIQSGKDFAEISATIVTAQGEERSLNLRIERGQSRKKFLEAAQIGLAPLDAAHRHTNRNYFAAGYGSRRRQDVQKLRSGQVERKHHRYAAISSLFSGDALLRPLDEVTNNASIEMRSTLAKSLDTFLPQDVRFHSIDEQSGRLYFTTPDGVLPLESLSNGYQQTIAWVSDLLVHVAHTFGDYKNPLNARGLLLIDEIDLHLHPTWQQQIHTFLTEGLPHFQVIATTYSMLTAGQAAQDELYVLRRDQEANAKLEPFTDSGSTLLLPLHGTDSTQYRIAC